MCAGDDLLVDAHSNQGRVRMIMQDDNDDDGPAIMRLGLLVGGRCAEFTVYH